MNTNLHYANAVVQTKSVTMKDAEQWEQDLATSQTDPDNTSDTPDTGNPKDSTVDWAKRYADLKSFMDKNKNVDTSKLTELQTTVAELQKQLKESSKPTLPSTDEELAEWRNNFPKVFDVVTTIVRKEKQSEIDELNGRIGELQQTLNSFAKHQGRVELLKAHPDANEIEHSPEFEIWLETQRPAIRQLAAGGVEDVSYLLNLYKTEMGLTSAAKKKETKEASKAITKGSMKADIPGEKRIMKESDLSRITNTRELEKALAEFEQARLEGRVEYDLSNKF
jgi:hypothetical protein